MDEPRGRGGMSFACECRAFSCGDVGCHRETDQTIVVEEASLDLCRACFVAHGAEALAVAERGAAS